MTDRWQACPVCKGRGDVPAAFYGLLHDSTVIDPRTTCRTCLGMAVLDTLSGHPPIPIAVSLTVGPSPVFLSPEATDDD
jgi:hypothetical protein